MERFLIDQKQIAKGAAKILEINPNHEIIQKLANNIQDDSKSSDNEQLVRILFDQACIIEGEPVHNAGDFSKRMSEYLAKALV